MPPKRVAYIDSLRCIAALAVLTQHLLERVAPTRFPAVMDCAPGTFGVVLFFYISGFVIPMSVQRRPAWLAFVIRRVFRIYPAYLATLAFMSVVAFVHGTQQPFARIGLVDSVLNLLLLQQYFGAPSLLGVTWTLSLEFAWYALFGLIFYQARNVRVSLLVFGFAAGMVLLTLASLVFHVRVPSGRLLLIGVALVGYLRWRQQSDGFTREHGWALTAFVCSMAFSLYVAFGVYTHPVFSLQRTAVAWTAATAVFLVATHASAERVRSALSLRPLVFLGGISYSVYLLHGPVYSLVIPLFDANTNLVLCPVLTVLAAWVSYRLVELPGVELGKRLEQRWQARVSSPNAAPLGLSQ